MLRIATTQLAIGLFCAVLGALMFLAPHQFNTPSFALLRPYISWFGGVFLLSGASLIGAMAVPVGSLLSVLSHLATGAGLVLLAAALAATGAWPGTTTYIVLGMGTASVPFLNYVQSRQFTADKGDFFAFILGLAGVVTGLYMLVLPDQFGQLLFDHIRPWLVWWGLAFVSAGAALTAVQISSTTPRWLVWVAHGYFALVFYSYVLNLTYPAWTAIGLYIGFGTLVLLLPWLSPRLEQLDTASLPVRLALVLAVMAALPLLIVVALIAYQDGRQATANALHLQKTVATVAARDIVSYLNRHQTAVIALADQLELASSSAEDQGKVLQAFQSSYPAMLTIATYDAIGRELTRLGPSLPSLDASFTGMQQTSWALLDIVSLSADQLPLILAAAPIEDGNGKVIGVVVGSIDASRLTEQLNQIDIATDNELYLLDGQASIVASTHSPPLDAAQMALWAPLKALREDNAGAGAIRYGDGEQDRLAGYARVPGTDWSIIAESPASVTLAGAMYSRDIAFIILMIITAAALSVGLLAARDLTTTLAMLVRAANQLESGKDTITLPQSAITEVASLSAAFASLRRRLAIRTVERDQAEASLRASEERYRTIVETAQEGIWLMNAAGETTLVNGAMAMMLGYDAEEMLGQPFTSFVAKSSSTDGTIHMNGKQVGITRWHDVPLCHKNGSIIWTIVFVHALRDKARGFAGALATVVDITERKQAEDRLRFLSESGTVLTTSLDYTTTLVSITRLIIPQLADWCVIDLLREDGTLQQMAMAHIDPNKEELIQELRHRYPPDLTADTSEGPGQVLHTGQAAMRVDISNAYLEATTVDANHLALCRALGMIGYMIVPLRARERLLGVISFIAGQSGRRYTGDDLAIAEEIAWRAALAVDNARLYHEAQKAIEMRDQFLSLASHELKTPLTALLGYVKLLQHRHEPGRQLTEREVRALRVMDEQATRLNRLITLMLDMSRIQTGQLHIEHAILDLAVLAQRVTETVEVGLEKHQLVVSLPESPVLIRGDELRLEQVVHNLVQNAVKYSPAGGIIEVEVFQEEHYAYLRVTDQGVGIPREALPQLFQRFQRIMNPDTAHVSGLGLGLYIAKEIVAQHGGEIEVISTERQGSTFTVCLPLQFAARYA